MVQVDKTNRSHDNEYDMYINISSAYYYRPSYLLMHTHYFTRQHKWHTTKEHKFLQTWP